MIQPLGVIFICIIFAISYLQPNFQFAVFIATVYLINRLFDYLEKIQGSLQSIVESIPYIEHVRTLQTEMTEFRETDRGTKPFVFDRELTLDHVSFSYEQKIPALQDISLIIPKGSMVGVVGPSGAGKTTLVDLLLRLYEPQQGLIYADDIPLADIRLAEWRKNVGYVPQEFFLQNMSVADNIKFHRDIPDDAMREAARFNGCQTDIKPTSGNAERVCPWDNASASLWRACSSANRHC